MIRLEPIPYEHKWVRDTTSVTYITELFTYMDVGIIHKVDETFECIYSILVGQNAQYSKYYCFGLRKGRIKLWACFT